MTHQLGQADWPPLWRNQERAGTEGEELSPGQLGGGRHRSHPHFSCAWQQECVSTSVISREMAALTRKGCGEGSIRSYSALSPSGLRSGWILEKNHPGCLGGLFGKTKECHLPSSGCLKK